ncbi:glucokinase [Mortierella claussenii]|nr:glucokinase [Mortierella claussenii]
MSTPVNARPEVIAHLTQAFAFPISAYDNLVEHFIHELHEGLTRENAMPMIPTYVYELPKGDETGVILSLDLGGTNLRVCRTTLSGNGEFEIIHKKWSISDSLKKGTGKDLFVWIAERIEEFLQSQCGQVHRDRVYPLGMTFSFPCEQLDINVGKLLFWTKGFRGNDVLGQDVVKILQDCIDAKRLNVTVNALINDTVGTLLATTYKHPGCEIGIIFGTGTNCAYLEEQSQITKIKPGAANYVSPSNHQLINTEWGAFGNTSSVLPANEYDRILDSRSSQPGKQVYEKMVSGLYISELARTVFHDLALRGELFVEESGQPKTAQELGDLAIKERFDGAMMGALEGDESDKLEVIESHFLTSYSLRTSQADRKTIKYICQLISARAARLSAVGIAALIKKRQLLTKPNQVIVGIDGSLFNKYPKFRQHLEGALNEIFDAATVQAKVSLINAEDGSGVGGAIAAYLVCKQKGFESIDLDPRSMSDSTPQPDYYLHLDLAEGELQPQPHGDGGESFLDFTGPVHEETVAAHQDTVEQEVAQWEENGVKGGLTHNTSVAEPSLVDETSGNYSGMLSAPVMGGNPAHWNEHQQVYGSLLDMELSKLSPPEQDSGCITPNLIFPSSSLQSSALNTEGKSTDMPKADPEALVLSGTPTVPVSAVKQATSGSSKRVSSLAAATPPPTDIRRSTRTRKPSSIAAQNEEYLATEIVASVPAERVTRSKKVYCYCQKPDDGEVMIQCDNCRQWFHGACVDITDEIAELMELKNEKFFCDPCTEKLEARAKSHIGGRGLQSSKLSDARDCVLPTCLNEARATSDYCSEECAIKGIELEASQAVKNKDLTKPSAIVIPPTKSLTPATSRKLSSPAQPSSPITPKSPGSPKAEQNPVRSTALKGITESLMMALEGTKEKETDADQASKLAALIEKELYMFTATPGQAGCGRDYKAKYRSLFFNLKDKNNESLRVRVLSGTLEPHELVRLTPEELANPELQSIAEEVRKRSIHDSVLTIEQEPFIKKTHKGDVSFIPGPSKSMSSSAETRTNEPSKDYASSRGEQAPESRTGTTNTPEDKAMEGIVQEQQISSKSTPVGSPTTEALDKLLAKIQTNKRSGEEVLNDALSSGKRQRQVEGIQDESSSYLPREPSPYSPSPSPSGSPALVSTTPPMSPPPALLEDVENSARSKSGPEKRQALPVWQGIIEMDQVAKFFTRAIQVGGTRVIPGRLNADPLTDMAAPGWSDFLTRKVLIEGRIPVSAVESYVAQQRQSSTKEVVIVRFEVESTSSSHEKHRAELNRLFRYFHEKSRNGVVPQKARLVKDMYIVPVAAKDVLPGYFRGLVENDALVLHGESAREDALFGVLVRLLLLKTPRLWYRNMQLPSRLLHLSNCKDLLTNFSTLASPQCLALEHRQDRHRPPPR